MDYLKQESNAGNTQVAFDSNYRPKLWESESIARETISAMWQIADIGFPSIDDEMALFGENESQVIDRLTQSSWNAGAIKRGELGPLSIKGTDIDSSNFKPASSVLVYQPVMSVRRLSLVCLVRSHLQTFSRRIF